MSSAPTPTTILPRTKPDLRQAMVLFSREVIAALACAQSGMIQAFYPGPPQTADVALNAAIVVGNQTLANGQVTPVTRAYPLLSAVPVIFLGGGGSALTFPVKVGDTCLIIFLDRDQDNWLTTGQVGMPPNSNRLHSLSDAVAIVGLRSTLNALTGFSATDMQLYGPDGPTGPILSMGEGKIALSNASQDLKTTLDNLMTYLGDLISALTGWVNTGGSTPNAATVNAIDAVGTNLSVVQTQLDALLKTL